MSVTYPRPSSPVAEPSERAKRLVAALWDMAQPTRMYAVAEAFLAEERQELLDRLARELDAAEAYDAEGVPYAPPPGFLPVRAEEEAYTGSESCS